MATEGEHHPKGTKTQALPPPPYERARAMGVRRRLQASAYVAVGHREPKSPFSSLAAAGGVRPRANDASKMAAARLGFRDGEARRRRPAQAMPWRPMIDRSCAETIYYEPERVASSSPGRWPCRCFMSARVGGRPRNRATGAMARMHAGRQAGSNAHSHARPTDPLDASRPVCDRPWPARGG
jgi:hypothetical protein